MAKEQWKKCSCCGLITDSDEENCPRRDFKDNPEHSLQIVELEDGEIKELWKGGNIYTKHVAAMERRLSK